MENYAETSDNKPYHSEIKVEIKEEVIDSYDSDNDICNLPVLQAIRKVEKFDNGLQTELVKDTNDESKTEIKEEEIGHALSTDLDIDTDNKTSLNDYMYAHTAEKPYQCSYCGQEYSNNINIIAHMKIHMQYKCDQCENSFSSDYFLEKHRKNHTGPPIEISYQCNSDYTCKICRKKFSNAELYVTHIIKQKYPRCELNNCNKYFKSEKLLMRHVRYSHYKFMNELERTIAIEKSGIPDVVRKEKTNMQCHDEGCMQNSTYFKSLQQLRKHKTDCHNEEHPQIIHKFSTVKDFEKWKEEEELKTWTSYSKKSADAYIVKTNTTRKLFFCKRSGTYTSRGEGLRKLKSIGSAKMGSYCTSTMEVNICNESNHVTVKYYSKHAGHDLDEDNLMFNQICQGDKNKAAEKLRDQIPKHVILDDLRASNNKRGKFIAMQDINNIAKKYGLNKPYALHTDDDQSTSSI